MKTIGLGVGIGELGVDFGLAEGLAGHLKVTDKVVMFAGVVGHLDDFSEVGRILRLDVRV